MQPDGHGRGSPQPRPRSRNHRVAFCLWVSSISPPQYLQLSPPSCKTCGLFASDSSSFQLRIATALTRKMCPLTLRCHVVSLTFPTLSDFEVEQVLQRAFTRFHPRPFVLPSHLSQRATPPSSFSISPSLLWRLAVLCTRRLTVHEPLNDPHFDPSTFLSTSLYMSVIATQTVRSFVLLYACKQTIRVSLGSNVPYAAQCLRSFLVPERVHPNSMSCQVTASIIGNVSWFLLAYFSHPQTFTTVTTGESCGRERCNQG
ncbi:hypothetical protein BXZ70DRAFT_635 [Cristinia sonorae]|uniref:Uncharacterized protein n=1 Tax=Cristinia sonorae TaxID=1940300 RepID=A0A8K0XUP9_9AGAR|nr:hypothetical protein BXZ70DRAFT_635 [Cristinia sonorae]